MKYLTFALDNLNNFLLALALLTIIWLQSLPDGPPIVYPTAREMSWLTRVAAGEARGELDDLTIAGICNTALNRMRLGLWGANLETVVRAPRQFSPLNAEDVNRAVILDPAFVRSHAYARVETICTMTVNGRLERRFADNTNGADHFFSGSKVPHWAVGRTPAATIGEFRFYRLLGRHRAAAARRRPPKAPVVASLESSYAPPAVP